jgi:hypothetical protein
MLFSDQQNETYFIKMRDFTGNIFPRRFSYVTEIHLKFTPRSQPVYIYLYPLSAFMHSNALLINMNDKVLSPVKKGD